MHLRRSYATIEPENHTGRDTKNDRKNSRSAKRRDPLLDE